MEHSITTGKRTQQSGFAYMALLVALLASSVALYAAIPDVNHVAKREREAQLLFAGKQYQQAIKRFYMNPYVSIQRYPENFEELLEDRRTPKPLHHLRRLYQDPMTADGKWGVVLNENDQITGVYSMSNDLMLKVAFDAKGISVDNYSGGALKYADLKFTYVPENKVTNTTTDRIQNPLEFEPE